MIDARGWVGAVHRANDRHDAVGGRAGLPMDTGLPTACRTLSDLGLPSRLFTDVRVQIAPRVRARARDRGTGGRSGAGTRNQAQHHDQHEGGGGTLDPVVLACARVRATGSGGRSGAGRLAPGSSRSSIARGEGGEVTDAPTRRVGGRAESLMDRRVATVCQTLVRSQALEPGGPSVWDPSRARACARGEAEVPKLVERRIGGDSVVLDLKEESCSGRASLRRRAGSRRTT